MVIGVAGCDPGTGKIAIGGLDNSGDVGGTGGNGTGGTGGSGGGGSGGSGGAGGTGGSGGGGGTGGSGGGGGSSDMATSGPDDMAHSATCTPGTTGAGTTSSYAVGSAQQHGNYIVARDANGYYGMNAICPHALCKINDFSQLPTIVCNCHGASWNFNGENGTRPAQGSTLQHYALCIDASGNITVTSTTVSLTQRY